jgi:hypothetical protein
MQDSVTASSSISDFTSQYEHHLLSVRGLSRNTLAVHRHVVQRLFQLRFQEARSPCEMPGDQWGLNLSCYTSSSLGWTNQREPRGVATQSEGSISGSSFLLTTH